MDRIQAIQKKKKLENVEFNLDGTFTFTPVNLTPLNDYHKRR